jgi:probable HAF family extracellular repeat protein
VDLGTLGGESSAATGLNDATPVQVVGQSDNALGQQRAFLWSNGAMQDLGTLGGSFSQASDINDGGQVVGRSHVFGDRTEHAFLWTNGAMQDLGTLGGAWSIALGINNGGQVVGHALTAAPAAEHAFLWQNGAMLDLNSLLPPGTGWVLVLARAINDRGQIVGEGLLNGEQRAFLLSPAPPTAPSLLTIAGASASRVSLAWTDNSSNETAFAIWRRSGADPFTRIAVVAPDVTTYSDPTVSPATSYTYRVRATNNVGASAWSNEAAATTPALPPPAPTGLSAAVASVNRINVSWQDNSSDEHAFALWRRTDATDWARIALLPPNTTSFPDTSITPGVSYTYRVRATRGDLTSAWSNEAAATAFSIDGMAYVATSATETLTATFTQPDGGISIGSYQGYVLLHVTGTGQAYGATHNDAFYLYDAPFDPPQNGHDGSYYQLTCGPDTLHAFDQAFNAKNSLVGPLPSYNPTHEYTFMVDTRLVSPGQLHVGVSDGGYSDNAGEFTIAVTQLVRVP